MVLHQNHGWASGGWMSDSLIDGNVGSGTQQQWISRNSEWGSWTGANWNMVFVGVPNPPQANGPSPPYTKVARRPIVREKPFLFVDAHGDYLESAFPRCVQLRRHHLARRLNARENDPARQVLHRPPRRHRRHHQRATRRRQASAAFTPGIYDLTEPIRVTRPERSRHGPRLRHAPPINGTAAITTADATASSSPACSSMPARSLNRRCC
jgi:hypothetical protein